jgi:hypothetical protein
MKDFIKKMNSVDISTLFKKKKFMDGSIDLTDGRTPVGSGNSSIDINWGSVPKPLILGLTLSGLMVIYGLIGVYQLYSAGTEMSEAELRWEQANQELLNVKQQFELKVNSGKKLISENSVFIASKGELEKEIYLFHKSAGMEIVKTNEEDIGGKKYTNYTAEGDFSGIQSVLSNMNAVSMYANINQVSISVSKEKSKLQLQMQLNYKDMRPLKSIINTQKMAYLDGSRSLVEKSYYHRIQFTPKDKQNSDLNNSAKFDGIKRDPFFKSKTKEEETNSIAKNSMNQQLSNDSSSVNDTTPFIILKGCITTENKKKCIYELPNKTVIYRQIGEEVTTGLRQVNIYHNKVILRKGKQNQTILVGGKINE